MGITTVNFWSLPMDGNCAWSILTVLPQSYTSEGPVHQMRVSRHEDPVLVLTISLSSYRLHRRELRIAFPR
jgi:hypothetical protein